MKRIQQVLYATFWLAYIATAILLVLALLNLWLDIQSFRAEFS